MSIKEHHWVLLSSFLKLPTDIEIDKESTTIINLTSPDFESTRNQIRSADVTLKHLLRNGNEYIVLERYFQNNWLRWNLTGVPLQGMITQDKPNFNEHASSHYETETATTWCKLGIESFLPYWKEDRQPVPDGDVYEQLPLDMKPPRGTIIEPKRLNESQGSVTDPASYLVRKYYETLFAVNIPLAYFVKSKLPRLKVLCKQQHTDYTEVLKSILVDMATFDKRNAADHHGLLNYEMLPEECKLFRKLSIQEVFSINIERTSSSKEILSDICTLLKLRDIKLQIIVLLELLAEGKLDSLIKQYELDHVAYLNERSMNMVTAVTRFSRRRTRTQPVKQKEQNREIDYCQNVDILLDKLGIAEVLISTELSVQKEQLPANKLLHEYKQGTVNKNKESSSGGFLSYVVIPYWYKRLPCTVTFIANKIKGPVVHRKQTVVQQGTSNRSRPGSVSSVSDDRSVSPQIPPLINARSSSNLVEFLEADVSKKKPVLASRSSSDLKLNRLQRRQMSVQDLSLDDILKQRRQVLEEFSTVRSVVINGRSVNFSQTQTNSFQRVGKRKLGAIHQEASQERDEEHVHITATPLKEDNVREISRRFVSSPAAVLSPEKQPPEEKSNAKRVRRRLFAP